MATAEEHIELYAQVRNQILGRFFAFGRYFRANHLSLDNQLGYLKSPDRPPAAPHDQDDQTIRCHTREVLRPSGYANAAGLRALPVAQQVLERWRVTYHDRENPLLYGSQLMVALAIERALGKAGALGMLRLAIQSIGQLYKFPDVPFNGYPIRWDAATSDRWSTQADGTQTRPLRCCDFLLDGEGRYLYCTPFNHPSYVRFNPFPYYGRDPYDPGQWRTFENNDEDPRRRHSLEWWRRWEPSMDELVGLVLTYDFVYDLVDFQPLRDEIRRQATNLAEYLAQHGYLLVRPAGGFTARGASGALPALEFPFTRAFERVTGSPHSSRATFEQAMRAAGVMAQLEESMLTWGLVGGALVGFPARLLPFVGTIAGVLGAAAGWRLGRAFGVFQARSAFDVWDENARTEFVLAYLFKQLGPRTRFTWWMQGMRLFGRHAKNFPPFLALSALADRSDTTVRDAYLSLLPELQADDRGTFGNMGLAAAAAVAHGDASQVSNLRRWLDEAYDELVGPRVGRHLHAADGPEGLVHEIAWGSPEEPMKGLEYMACLALSWLTVKRAAEVGTPIDPAVLPGLPPEVPSFPPPRVPTDVLAAGIVPTLETIGGFVAEHGVFPQSDEEEEAEVLPPTQTHPPDPPPQLPPVTQTYEFAIHVPEGTSLVDPNIVLHVDDRVTISQIGGTIWCGDHTKGRNGPGGMSYTAGAKFPLPGGHVFSLLYKIVELGNPLTGPGWLELGTQNVSWVVDVFGGGKLLFRTNDDVPGGGDGEFTCNVEVARST